MGIIIIVVLIVLIILYVKSHGSRTSRNTSVNSTKRRNIEPVQNRNNNVTAQKTASIQYSMVECDGKSYGAYINKLWHLCEFMVYNNLSTSDELVVIVTVTKKPDNEDFCDVVFYISSEYAPIDACTRGITFGPEFSKDFDSIHFNTSSSNLKATSDVYSQGISYFPLDSVVDYMISSAKAMEIGGRIKVDIEKCEIIEVVRQVVCKFHLTKCEKSQSE